MLTLKTQTNEKHENDNVSHVWLLIFFLPDSQFAFTSLFSVWLIYLVFYVTISSTSKTSLKQKRDIKFILVLYLLEKIFHCAQNVFCSLN